MVPPVMTPPAWLTTLPPPERPTPAFVVMMSPLFTTVVATVPEMMPETIPSNPVIVPPLWLLMLPPPKRPIAVLEPVSMIVPAFTTVRAA